MAREDRSGECPTGLMAWHPASPSRRGRFAPKPRCQPSKSRGKKARYNACETSIHRRLMGLNRQAAVAGESGLNVALAGGTKMQIPRKIRVVQGSIILE